MGFKPKKCFVCGRIFVPKNGKQICCNEECAKEYADIIRYTYYRDDMFNHQEIDDYLTDEVFISEAKLKLKPSLTDKIKVKKILSDFEIQCDIPDFDTLNDLNNWKRNQLKLAIIGH